jgi:hypothetical protein
VSTDATYGYTKENPIKGGGRSMFEGPSREEAYLSVLRGPRGEAITYKRLGSVPGPNAILDIYQITYPGLQKPIQLYVDMYNYSEPKAPIGFICASPFPLQKP